MLRRFLIVLTVALLLQAVGFAVYYDDLLYLRQPVSTLAHRPSTEFEAEAREALDRPKLTVHHLETLAETAKELGLHDIEVTALERRALLDQASNTPLRLADALRRAGRFAEAEAIYLDLLADAGSSR